MNTTTIQPGVSIVHDIADVGPAGERVLVLTPTGRDAVLACTFLLRAGVRAHTCPDMAALCRELDTPSGAALVSEEALAGEALEQLAQRLKQQPPWSDLPVIVLGDERTDAGASAKILAAIGNATWIQRPARGAVLMSAVQTALRARRRQYQMREHFAEREAREQAARMAARLEQTLRTQASAARDDLERVLESIRDELIIVDRGWRILYANDPVTARGARAKDAILGKSLWEVFSDMVGGKFYHEAQRAMTESSVRQFEYYHPQLERWFEYRLQPQAQGLLILRRDITERKHAGEQWSHLAAIVESSAHAFISHAPDGTITGWNSGAERIYGYSAGEAVGRSPALIVPPEHLPETEAAFARVYAGAVERLDTERLRRDGTRLSIDLSLSPIRNADGSVIGISAIETDISARVQMESALRESEERCRRLVEFSPNALLVCVDDQIVYANRAALAFCAAAEAHELLGRSPTEFFGGGALQWHDGTLGSGDAVQPLHQKWTRLDGAVLDVEAHAMPIPWNGGNAVQIVLQDVTERRRILESLQKSRAALAKAQTIAHVGSWEWDVVNNAISWSDEMYRIFGLAPQSRLIVYPDFVDELVLAPQRARLHDALRAALAHGRAFDMELGIQLPDGNERVIQLSAEVTRDAQYRMTSIVGAAQDITRRKQAEDAVRISDLRFRTALKSAPIGMFQHDRELRYTWVHNPIGDLSVEQIVGKRDSDVLGDAAAADVMQFKQAVIDSGVGARQRVALPVHGQEHQFDLICEPLHDDAGEVNGLTCAAMDITEHAALQAQLRRQADQLARMDQRKNEFMAMLAHELRNPLAPIHNAVHVLKIQPDPPDTKHVRWALDVIGRQVQHLGRLVDDLLDIARITHGRIRLNRQVIDLCDVLAQTIENTRPVLEARRHGFSYTAPPAALRVYADPTRLAQVVSNLLNNAARYTPPGGDIAVAVTHNGEQAVISVRDNGIGISADALPHIFDLFMQGTRTSDDMQGGLGLGLALVQRLVELHGGHVTANSDGQAKGSEFRVYLPLVQETDAVAPETAAPTAAAPAGIRVLVVDDNEDVAQSFAVLLRILGHTVEAVGDAGAALETVKRFRPEVAFIDIGLPDIDGYELARRLRADYPPEALRLIALTGYGQEEVRGRTHAAGFDAHVLKPGDVETLEALLGSMRK